MVHVANVVSREKKLPLKDLFETLDKTNKLYLLKAGAEANHWSCL